MTDYHALVRRFIESLDQRDWDTWRELMTEDVIYEIPQSRERIRGRDRYEQFNREYPGDWNLVAKVIIADEHNGVVWFDWLVDSKKEDDAMAFFEFNDDKISTITDFWPEPFDPPTGREHLTEPWPTSR